jgi:hypothetical protein
MATGEIRKIIQGVKTKIISVYLSFQNNKIKLMASINIAIMNLHCSA